MQIPVMRGLIDRRILVNFRVKPAVLAAQLPAPFRPKLVDGWGMAGICLIRLKEIRPKFFPRQFGIGSENAAHRVAVEWDENGVPREGVFVARRDSSSRLNALLGGRLFPGEHHLASFDVREDGREYSVTLNSNDGDVHVSVSGYVSHDWPADSVFHSQEEASEFFRAGSLGYSVTSRPGTYDGLELRTADWSVQTLAVEHVESSYFDDRTLFPAGMIQFDNALLMKQIEHEWHGHEPICCAAGVT